VCYSELYVEEAAQLMESGTVALMVCGTVNIMLKLLHRMGKVEFCFEWSVFQKTVCAF